MKDIIILVGSAIGSALALIRAIKKEIVCKVYVLSTNSQRITNIIASSKFVDEVHLMSANDEKISLQNIQQWYQTKAFNNKPILYFTYDNACFYTDNNREWFEEHFTLCLPSSEIIQTYTQKGLAEHAARKVGLTIPKTKTIDTVNDIHKVEREFNFPLIIKPRAQYLKGDINFKIKVFDSPADFKVETTQIIERGNSLLCQEFIPGSDENAWYYLFYRSKNGTIYENMGKKILQSTSNGGTMVKGISEYNRKLSEISRNFLNKIDYKGIGGIEFKKHNNTFYFIEMSVRLEGFFKITEKSKIPLSLISYYDLLDCYDNLSVFKDIKQKNGVIYIDFLLNIITRIKSKQFFALMKDLFQIFFKKNIFLNVFSKNDSKPFFLTLKNLLAR